MKFVPSSTVFISGEDPSWIFFWRISSRFSTLQATDCICNSVGTGNPNIGKSIFGTSKVIDLVGCSAMGKPRWRYGQTVLLCYRYQLVNCVVANVSATSTSVEPSVILTQPNFFHDLAFKFDCHCYTLLVDFVSKVRQTNIVKFDYAFIIPVF